MRESLKGYVSDEKGYFFFIMIVFLLGSCTHKLSHDFSADIDRFRKEVSELETMGAKDCSRMNWQRLNIYLGYLEGKSLEKESFQHNRFLPSIQFHSVKERLEELLREMKDCLSRDDDDDGISNFREKTVTKTNPYKADTDGDGLWDGEEVMRVGSDPLKVDSDSDRIPDGRDKAPLQAETYNGYMDEDGIPDEAPITEVVFLTEKVKLFLESILFDFNSWKISDSFHPILNEMASVLIENPSMKLLIEGHTDWMGSEEYNLSLSKRRANNVRDYLILKGVAPDRLLIIGKGEGEPAAPNYSEDGRARNRRVEFYLKED